MVYLLVELGEVLTFIDAHCGVIIQWRVVLYSSADLSSRVTSIKRALPALPSHFSAFFFCPTSCQRSLLRAHLTS